MVPLILISGAVVAQAGLPSTEYMDRLNERGVSLWLVIVGFLLVAGVVGWLMRMLSRSMGVTQKAVDSFVTVQAEQRKDHKDQIGSIIQSRDQNDEKWREAFNRLADVLEKKAEGDTRAANAEARLMETASPNKPGR